MLTRIEATNYRCFERLGAPCRAFQVLAGANGSGKTTLLDIPIVIGDMLRGRNVAAAFLEGPPERGARAGSLHELLFRPERENFGLAVEAALPEPIQEHLLAALPTPVKAECSRAPTHIRYEVRLRVDQGHQLEVMEEFLFAFNPTERQAGENGFSDDCRFILRRLPSREPGPSEVFFRPEGAQERSTKIDATLLALERRH